MKDNRTMKADVRMLKARLASLPINAHLTTPRSEVLNTKGFPEWSQYDFVFDDYMNIATAGCQIVCNETPRQEGFINNSMARSILCAMYKQKVIVLLHVPVFGDDVDDFSKALIAAKLDKFYICNLLRLDATDFNNFLYEINNKVIGYSLTNHDLLQIKNRVHIHLRQLQINKPQESEKH